MSEDSKRDKSRNSPRLTLEDAINAVKKLHTKAGKSKISPEVAVGAMGYGGLNGAALTTLGAINQYGLIDRERGKTVSVSPLAIRIIHPIDPDQELTAKRESALIPKVFNELFSGGFHKCDEDLISNHLIQNEFTPDGARKAASAFKANVEFAKLVDYSINNPSKKYEEGKSSHGNNESSFSGSPKAKGHIMVGASLGSDFPIPPTIGGTQVLATYSVPIGANEVQIAFRGQELRLEDFDALSDYVSLFKKQFERKLQSEAEGKKIEKVFEKF